MIAVLQSVFCLSNWHVAAPPLEISAQGWFIARYHRGSTTIRNRDFTSPTILSLDQTDGTHGFCLRGCKGRRCESPHGAHQLSEIQSYTASSRCPFSKTSVWFTSVSYITQKLFVRLGIGEGIFPKEWI